MARSRESRHDPIAVSASRPSRASRKLLCKEAFGKPGSWKGLVPASQVCMCYSRCYSLARPFRTADQSWDTDSVAKRTLARDARPAKT